MSCPRCLILEANSSFTAEAIKDAYDLIPVRSPRLAVESSPYEIDPDLCRAFVAGLLESGPSRERAADAIGHWCAERGIDPDLLLDTLDEALAAAREGGAR